MSSEGGFGEGPGSFDSRVVILKLDDRLRSKSSEFGRGERQLGAKSSRLACRRVG